MNAEQYQAMALRTMADQEKIRERVFLLGVRATQLDNGARGLADDAGEVNGVIKAHLEYGKDLDETHLLEELGDVVWRVVQICDAMGWPLSKVFTANIAKLAKRYPEGYSDFLAAEENRDRAAEKKAVEASIVPADYPMGREQTGAGFSEPPFVSEPAASFGDGLVRPKDLTSSYDRYCVVCKRNPVHRSNTIQTCPNCKAKQVAAELESRDEKKAE